jgi:hypothetical protein
MITDNEINGMSEASRRARLTNLALGREVLQDRSKNTHLRAGGLNSSIAGGLKGDLDPVRLARRETPVHRTMVNMAAAGYTNREISLFTGYNPTTVATAIKQPHAREYLINEAKKTVQDEIKALLEAEALPSIKTLVAVRDNTEGRGSDRVAASNSILDRFLGKPVQPISENAKPPSELTDAQLREQIERELTASRVN